MKRWLLIPSIGSLLLSVIVLLGLHFAILHYASAKPSTLPPQPTNLSVNYRSGQSFITWTERADVVSETYRIYRYSQEITSANLMSAALLYEVPDGTARFFENRFYTGSVWKNRYLDRYVIQDHGTQLITGTGLLVWTFSPQDFDGGSSGNAYYAVTTVDSGTENRIDFSSDNSIGPISEAITDPLPVEISNTVGAGWHVFIQYMDLRNWNPTFHAPNSTNSYYGLNPADPEVLHALQYAYDYAIYQPGATQCGSTIPAQIPVSVWLHPWQGNNYPPASSSSTWCAYRISPIDETETWWFGFARDHNYRAGGSISNTDRIVNYTEQRVLWMIYDLERNPIGPAVDPNRIYVSGFSMGAGGTLGFALRYPNVFAAAYATKPPTNYQLAGGWVGNISAKWGSVAMGVPVLITAPNHWADGLQAYNGLSVWNWENHQSNLINRQADPMVPFAVVHAYNDTTLPWSTQGKPAYAAYNASRQVWASLVTADDHANNAYQGLPPNFQTISPSIPFSGFTVLRNETVPALSNDSLNPSIPPTNALAGFNQTVRWSASWDRWDGAPIDTQSYWQMSFCAVTTTTSINVCGTGMTQTVDITPRRLQNFVVMPNVGYQWQSRAVGDDILVADGVITPDGYGLLTVQNFQVTPHGNRLVLFPITAIAQLSLTKIVTPASNAVYHAEMTYTLVLSNFGSGYASGVRLTDTLPIETDFTRWIDQPSGATINSDQITWTGAVSVNQTIKFTFVVTHVGGYDELVTNTAYFNHTSGGGSATAVIVTAPPPDLGGSLKFSTPNTQPVLPNSLITYTLVLSNNGGMSDNTSVTDVLGFYYTVFDAMNFAQSPTGTLTWSGLVAAGQSITLNYVVKVNTVSQLTIGHTVLSNSAIVDDGLHAPFNVIDPSPSWVDIYGVYLPILNKNS